MKITSLALISDICSVYFIGFADEPSQLWISRCGCTVDILSCKAHSWDDYHSLDCGVCDTVTALCQVGDAVWLGDLRGKLHAFR